MSTGGVASVGVGVRLGTTVGVGVGKKGRDIRGVGVYVMVNSGKMLLFPAASVADR